MNTDVATFKIPMLLGMLPDNVKPGTTIGFHGHMYKVTKSDHSLYVWLELDNTINGKVPDLYLEIGFRKTEVPS